MDIPEVVYNHYLKVPVCCTNDYIFRFEGHICGTLAHCDVFRWNKTVKNNLIKSWQSICHNHGGPLYAVCDKSDNKKQKFMKLLGFKFFEDYEQSQEIWIWSNYGKSC